MKALLAICMAMIIFTGATAGETPAKAGDFDWLCGSWQRISSKSITVESWQRLNRYHFAGTSYRFAKDSGDTLFVEDLLLSEMGGDIFYLAKVGENPLPVAFRLIEFAPERAVFENTQHDFPQRIVYQRITEDSLLVTVAGKSGGEGEERQILFSFRRMPDSAADKKVTGIGGIFFKSNNPAKLREWYATNLGLAINEYGSMFEFREGAAPHDIGYLQWSPFKETTEYFQPSEKQFMINYRVANIEKLVSALQESGVQILDKIETYDYGKFVHIMDPEGNKIELWEPVDNVFTKQYEGKTTR